MAGPAAIHWDILHYHMPSVLLVMKVFNEANTCRLICARRDSCNHERDMTDQIVHVLAVLHCC